MRILVTAASKHGSTAEIARAIATGLVGRGMDADLRPPAAVRSLEGYDAVVLGSAVYAGRWLEPARELVERLEGALAERPVWLFSSGPLGAPEAKPAGDPADAAPMLDRTGAEEHRVFAGRLERAQLTFGERALCRALQAPFGDFRDWDAIDAYAGEIAARLAATLAR